MDQEMMHRLQELAEKSPLAPAVAGHEDLNKLAEQFALVNPDVTKPASPNYYTLVGNAHANTSKQLMQAAYKPKMKPKAPKAKRPSKSPAVRQYADKVRRMTDEQIWAEGHKEPTQAVIEYVIKEIHEDLLSVLAPHFGDDIMAKIDQVLGDWYHVKTGHTFSGNVVEGGIDRPLTEEDRTVASGILGREYEQQELEKIREEAMQRGSDS